MLTLILISGLVPVIAGIAVHGMHAEKKKLASALVLGAIAVSLASNLAICFNDLRGTAVAFALTAELRIAFRVDAPACFFSLLFTLAFALTAVYALSYFQEDGRKPQFDCFYLLSFGALMLLCYSGNLITMYICFEMVTLMSMPLVLHDKTKESVDAALKYLIYSVGGAFLGFIGVVYLSLNTSTDLFTPGGTLVAGVAGSNVFLTAVLLMFIGFGAKCGLFPLHNWLPTAHPVAPAPASALLSGIITKSGVVAVYRILCDVVGTEAFFGTWAHKTWLSLILLTILLGSFMAVVQKNFKKRLAFSSVSQISYVLLGLAMMNGQAMAGAVLQIASHAVIKIGLFLTAGASIRLLGVHDVDEMDGAGYRMPVTMWCYTVCALGLVGVPPTGGFVAKWYLAEGALNSGLGALSVIAPAVLIVSAILTAYYLLSVTVSAFFPSDKTKTFERVKEPAAMVIPLIVLAVLTVAIGIFSGWFVNFSAGWLTAADAIL